MKRARLLADIALFNPWMKIMLNSSTITPK